MYPSKEEAMKLLNEAYDMNPGPWREHSLVVAECACRIAKECPDMNADKAYILGLLHDIGRRFGITALAHVIDGYDYLMSYGYDEAARICITHSFAIKDINTAIVKNDVSDDDTQRIIDLLNSYEYDDYDRLIQVCDSIAMPYGPVDIKKRMSDVKERYGCYPQNKWDKHLELKLYFENIMGKKLEDVVN
jgi:hypothetical protein